MRAVRLAVLGLCFLAALTARGRAEDYPVRPVTLVVPFAAGGAVDVVARLLGQQLSERLGWPVIVEERPGAGTVIAANYAAKSAPDGYTLLWAVSSTQAINATLYKKLPYDPAKDLIPVALIGSVPFVLVVNPSLPVQSVADLIRLAKEKPGELNYGSGGVGSAHHLFAELFSTMAGIKMTHVPYKGTLPALTDVVAGHIPLMFSDPAPALPLIEAGRLRALGVTTAERAAAAPRIAPIAEEGVPGYDAAAWQMVVAPAGTPAEIIVRLNRELNTMISGADIRQKLAALGLNPIGKGAPDELDRFLASEIVRWGKVVQQAGIAGSAE
ncbi:MAG TPA: tripartite tricarboxylate transporter substrate binding protein [Xanthobacteraceae bacterium]